MNPDWSLVHERATALAFDQQTASARVVTWQKSHTERKRPGKSTATSLLLRLLYWIYERRLLDQLKQGPTPRHIGIILDGNRRHARKRGVSDPCEIYQRGAEKLDDILDWCSELRIPAVTLWVFSTENLKRSQAEISGILSAIEAKVAALAHAPFMHQKGVRIQAIGLFDPLVDRHPHPEPRMPMIKQFSENGPVGVLKPCCTIRSGRRPHLATSHQHERLSCHVRRVAGCATSTGFAGHAGTTANLKLTFDPDHSVGANQ